MCCNSSNPPELIKKVFSSLSMKCASCCCHNNEVDCIAFHCMQRGAPFVHVVFLHSSQVFAQTIRHYGFAALSNPTPVPTKLTSNQWGSWAPHCFFALELSLSLSIGLLG